MEIIKVCRGFLKEKLGRPKLGREDIKWIL
jgi:hypothetical protein